MHNFIQRALSGVVYVGLVIGAIWFHPLFFGVLFLLLCGLACHEYLGLRQMDLTGRIIGSAASCLLFAMVWTHYFYLDHPHWLQTVFATAYVVLLVGVLVGELFRKAEDPIRNWGDIWISQIMVAIPFALMNYILSLSSTLLLSLFILIWLNDTGAYLVGSLTALRKSGNHKMFPRVSPKKSWEGLVGGILVAVAASVGLAYMGWLDILPLWGAKWISPAVLAVLITIFGNLGDLMESLMKRTIGVKDSGKFMPGHGGVLDRFDSILLACPIVSLFVWAVLR